MQSGSPNIELGGGGGLNLKWLPGGTRDFKKGTEEGGI